MVGNPGAGDVDLQQSVEVTWGQIAPRNDRKIQNWRMGPEASRTAPGRLLPG